MKIALGVTGGIAAYKAAEIVRLLQDRGVRVQVIMTRAAQEFVRPLTFAALSGEKVITSMFASGEEQTPNIDSAIEHMRPPIDRPPRTTAETRGASKAASSRTAATRTGARSGAFRPAFR